MCVGTTVAAIVLDVVTLSMVLLLLFLMQNFVSISTSTNNTPFEVPVGCVGAGRGATFFLLVCTAHVSAFSFAQLVFQDGLMLFLAPTML